MELQIGGRLPQENLTLKDDCAKIVLIWGCITTIQLRLHRFGLPLL
jgi:hypothetical protein